MMMNNSRSSTNSLSVDSVVLIPINPFLDFGAIDPYADVGPQIFVIDSTTEDVGTITCSSPWLDSDPNTFSKGRTEISIKLVPWHLERGSEYEAIISINLRQKQFTIPVHVKVRQIGEDEIEALFMQLPVLENNMMEMVAISEGISSANLLRHYIERSIEIADEMQSMVEPLAAALEDNDIQVRRHAALALGKTGNINAIGPLIQALGDVDNEVRSYAAQALGEIASTVKRGTRIYYSTPSQEELLNAPETTPSPAVIRQVIPGAYYGAPQQGIGSRILR